MDIKTPPKMNTIKFPPKMFGHVRKHPNYYVYTFVLFGVYNGRGITEVLIDGNDLVVTVELREKCSWRYPLPEDANADAISAKFIPEKLFVKVHKKKPAAITPGDVATSGVVRAVDNYILHISGRSNEELKL